MTSAMLVFAHIQKNFAAAFFPRLSEWWAASVMFALGWMLAANPDLMASSPARIYDAMLSIAPQTTWSSSLIIFACLRLTVLLINGAWRRSPHLRALSAFLSCFLWTQITLSFATSLDFSFVLACGWLGTDMINIMRAMRDARLIDHYVQQQGKTGGIA